MKAILLFSLVMVFTCQLHAQNKSVETLKRMNEDWIRSYPSKDSVTLERIFANDFILISPDGNKMTRRDVIRNLRRQEILSVNIDSADVRMLDEKIGVVTAYMTFVFKEANTLKTGRVCYQDIYMQRKKRWVAVAAHVSLLSVH
ncbi:nuclear transport factor 2 family protein [Chryseolinea soli]|uniref:Nuclear transport factor 2 family protein n=1 Tax=Chryseolinea soli TaxID=2321403 RepID=A0A385SDB3_9BACT|nr:nuclear transport factor 2 family protein [Chryseolinea soli]AYB29209.1 nuclear transport factor 2 family protein [Chryseolinea soli]